jgi:hypothetical protein
VQCRALQHSTITAVLFMNTVIRNAVLLISIPVLRMNTGTMYVHINIIIVIIIYICAQVSSYSKVEAVEQRHVVNSGMGGKKDRNPRPRSGWIGILL